MRTCKPSSMVLAAAMVLLATGQIQAVDVFNMGGTRDPLTGTWTGVANLETVPVGNPGNVGDTPSYGSYGSYGSVPYVYQMGKYEVTAGQYTEFLKAVAKTDTYELYNTAMWSNTDGCKIQRSGTSGSYTYSVATDFANRPVNYVSWYDAIRFTNWLQNGQTGGGTESGTYTITGGGPNNGTVTTPSEATRATWTAANKHWVLPSENEWYKSAYHKNDGVTGNYYAYPTSSDTEPGRDMTDASGNNANIRPGPGAYPIDSGKYTTVVGEFQNSDSPYGTFDQGGNVWEWNETDINLDSSSRGLRGGSFYDGGSNGLLSSYRDSRIVPSLEYARVGFRVASVPEPGSITLLVAGTFGLIGFAWRRRAS